METIIFCLGWSEPWGDSAFSLSPFSSCEVSLLLLYVWACGCGCMPLFQCIQLRVPEWAWMEIADLRRATLQWLHYRGKESHSLSKYYLLVAPQEGAGSHEPVFSFYAALRSKAPRSYVAPQVSGERPIHQDHTTVFLSFESLPETVQTEVQLSYVSWLSLQVLIRYVVSLLLPNSACFSNFLFSEKTMIVICTEKPFCEPW